MDTLIYFETSHLIVRQYTLEDAAALCQIMSDSRVHYYTKDRNHPWTLHRAADYIRFMLDKDFRTLDCFHGAIIEKTSGQLIGLCGLNPYEQNKPEIEFKLGVSYWNKGYATELAEQILHHAFATGKVRGVYGIAHPDNVASRRVLEKIGMHYLGEKQFRNQIDSFYYIECS